MKTVDQLDLRKMLMVCCAVSDEHTQTQSEDQRNESMEQFRNEIAELSKGFNDADRLKIFETAYKQLEQFNKQPEWKELFRGPVSQMLRGVK